MKLLTTSLTIAIIALASLHAQPDFQNQDNPQTQNQAFLKVELDEHGNFINSHVVSIDSNNDQIIVESCCNHKQALKFILKAIEKGFCKGTILILKSGQFALIKTAKLVQWLETQVKNWDATIQLFPIELAA